MGLPKLIAVIGATGTGKTEFSLDLATQLINSGNGVEIVNADAMQLYSGMNIGTAKIAVEEMRSIPHHLFDVFSVEHEVTVSEYQKIARSQIQDINNRGNIAILVGGSGLYVSSVLFDFEFPGHDDAIRLRLESELVELGPEVLYQRLLSLAPDVAERIDAKNPRRIVRALEVVEMSGDSEVIGTLPEDQKLWQPAVIFGLREDRETLVKRLDNRVQGMWQAGIVEEVKSLIPRGLRDGVTARRAIGYAQALAQIDGEYSEQEAISETQLLTRRFARRQVSWFKRYRDVHWLQSADKNNMTYARQVIEQ